MKNLEGLSDVELMSKMKNGQRDEAFEILYKKYSGQIYGLCLKRCRDVNLAEDITSEAFIKLFMGCDTFKEVGITSVTPWLYQIARNLMTDYYRKKDLLRTCLPLPELKSLNAFAQDEDNPEEKLILEERKNFFKKYINSLDDKHNSEILESRYCDELSYEEISQKFGITYACVKARLFRARALLREKMESNKDFFRDD